jgi:hypothetical protein
MIHHIYIYIYIYIYILYIYIIYVYQEDIDVAESEPETPSPYTGAGKRGGNVETAEASMSESCTEVSISDRRYEIWHWKPI